MAVREGSVLIRHERIDLALDRALVARRREQPPADSAFEKAAVYFSSQPVSFAVSGGSLSDRAFA